MSRGKQILAASVLALAVSGTIASVANGADVTRAIPPQSCGDRTGSPGEHPSGDCNPFGPAVAGATPLRNGAGAGEGHTALADTQNGTKEQIW
jgi:hypothetical protein